MDCDQCGAPRPRTGPCPECGAPPPGRRSSLSQWKGRADDGYDEWGSGSRQGGGRRGGSQGGPGRSMRTHAPGASARGSDWGAGRRDADWDDDPYADERPSQRMGSARRQSAPDYEEVDLERALVPTQGGMMPMEMGAGVPALPGFPATEEEERALGIRRPVYIPATGEKRKVKLGTWRVLSGVLSVMLVCIASCGIAGLVGRNQIQKLILPPIQTRLTVATPSYKNVPATPVATPGPSATTVRSVVTAQGVDANIDPVTPTSHFLTNTEVFAVVQVRGITKGEQHTLHIRWFLNGVDLQLPAGSKVDQPVTEESNTYFGLIYPTAGVGMAKIYWDKPANDPGNDPKDPHLAQTIYFAIQAPAPTATPNPAGTSAPKTTPKPSTTTTPGKADAGAPPVADVARRIA